MNAPFSIRASSLAELFDCPARWEAKHIRGLRLPIGGAGRMGTAIHEGTTLHDFATLNDTRVSIDDCESVLVDQIWNPDEDVDWADIDQQTAETTGRALLRRYIQTIAPQQDYIGVEVKAEPLTIVDAGITLTGTIDRIYQTADGRLGIGDIKTGKTACAADGTVKTAGHGVQMGVYTLLAEHALGEPVEAPARIYGLTTGKTEKGQHVGVGEIPSPTDALIGSEGRPGLLHHASALLKSGLFYGNPRSTLCSEKFCPAYSTCPFRK